MLCVFVFSLWEFLLIGMSSLMCSVSCKCARFAAVGASPVTGEWKPVTASLASKVASEPLLPGLPIESPDTPEALLARLVHGGESQ